MASSNSMAWGGSFAYSEGILIVFSPGLLRLLVFSVVSAISEKIYVQMYDFRGVLPFGRIILFPIDFHCSSTDFHRLSTMF
jgi:hypothetical protein